MEEEEEEEEEKQKKERLIGAIFLSTLFFLAGLSRKTQIAKKLECFSSAEKEIKLSTLEEMAHFQSY